MSTQENKALIRRYLAQLDADPIGAIEAYTSADYVAYVPGAPAPLDREGFKPFAGVFYAAFPNLRHDFEDQIAEGDLVASRITARGTHSGDFQGVPPTGKDVAIDAIAIYRIRDGKVAEFWLQLDALGLMQQLDAMPAATPA